MSDHPLKRHSELDQLIANAHRRGDSEAERTLMIEKQSLGYGIDHRLNIDSDAAEPMGEIQGNIERLGWAAVVSLFDSLASADPVPNPEAGSLFLNLFPVRYITHDDHETSKPPRGDFNLRYGCSVVAAAVDICFSDRERHVVGPHVLVGAGQVDLLELEVDYRLGRYNTVTTLIAGVEEHIRQMVRDQGGLTVKKVGDVERPNTLGGLLHDRVSPILGWNDNTTTFVRNLLVCEGSKALRNFYQHGRFPSRQVQKQDMAVLIAFASWLLHQPHRAAGAAPASGAID